jgi:hypothetical protein
LAGDVHSNQAFEFIGRPQWVRRAHRSAKISEDLHRRHDKAPGKSPPPKQEAVKSAAELALHSATAAGDLLHVVPVGDDQGRPDTVAHVNINGARPTALRATSLVRLQNLFLNQTVRQLMGEVQKISAGGTSGIAIAKSALALPAKDNYGFAICATGHDGIPA